MSDLESLLRKHLGDWRSGWSMGSFGAIAEFHQDASEVPVIDDQWELTRATRRGAIRLDREALDRVTPVAYETPSPKKHRWSHALALCMRQANSGRAARDVLAELGPDDDAIRGIDRTGILFDMGLAQPQSDFCIRTSDPRLLGVLRANLNRSLFEPGNPAMAAILAAHPHRVALTDLGRVEVYQKIGGPDTGGVSPPGPHTHVLPKLLRAGRTHSANTPIPDGLWPLASLHPGNPVMGPMGEDQDFDPKLHADFQALLAKYGAPGIVAVKIELADALAGGRDPAGYTVPDGRFERAAVRVGIRQFLRSLERTRRTEDLALAARWRDRFDQGAEHTDDDAPGH